MKTLKKKIHIQTILSFIFGCRAQVFVNIQTVIICMGKKKKNRKVNIMEKKSGPLKFKFQTFDFNFILLHFFYYFQIILIRTIFYTSTYNSQASLYKRCQVIFVFIQILNGTNNNILVLQLCLLFEYICISLQKRLFGSSRSRIQELQRKQHI